jgi:hypothetical protein
MAEVDPIPKKLECYRCGYRKPLNDRFFYPDSAEEYGFFPLCKKCLHKSIQRQRERKEVRLKVLIHYSGDPPCCACCGETHYEFLTTVIVPMKESSGKVGEIKGRLRPGPARSRAGPDRRRTRCHRANFVHSMMWQIL